MSDPPAPEENAAENAVVSASVAVKLPDFWKNDPVMWFAQAEAQFALANVVRDHTKFQHIVAKIDQTVICHVADLVMHPPETGKYEAVKMRLISRFQVSPQGRLERLLNACDLGDMRPTHLLAKMQELSAGLNVNDDLLKMLFLQRLPPNVKTVLTISDGRFGTTAKIQLGLPICGRWHDHNRGGFSGDLRHRRRSKTSTFDRWAKLSSTGGSTNANFHSVTVVATDHPFRDLLVDFRNVTLPTTMKAAVQHDVTHPNQETSGVKQMPSPRTGQAGSR